MKLRNLLAIALVYGSSLAAIEIPDSELKAIKKQFDRAEKYDKAVLAKIEIMSCRVIIEADKTVVEILARKGDIPFGIRQENPKAISCEFDKHSYTIKYIDDLDEESIFDYIFHPGSTFGYGLLIGAGLILIL